MGRNTLMIMMGLTMGTTAPLAAQRSEADTSISISRNNGVTECRVQVDGRRLSDADAEKLCSRAEERTALLRWSVDSLRAGAEMLAERIGRIHADSLAIRFGGQAELLADQLREVEGQRRFFSGLLPTLAARPIIGVTVDPSPRDTDRYGAYVQAVTPGGPADKAGLRSGDVIVRVGGKAIGTGDRNQDRGDSPPSLKLIEVVGALEADKAVRIDYRRDNRERNAMVTPVADRSVVALRAEGFPVGRPGTFYERSIDGVPVAPSAPRSVGGRMTMSAPATAAFTFTTGALARIEMAPVNEKLGSYFGVTRGVLVVNAPETENMGLQAGDVVTAVDGRRVETPSEFLRVMRTYDRDREFTLQVTREKRQQNITTKLP